MQNGRCQGDVHRLLKSRDDTVPLRVRSSPPKVHFLTSPARQDASLRSRTYKGHRVWTCRSRLAFLPTKTRHLGSGSWTVLLAPPLVAATPAAVTTPTATTTSMRPIPRHVEAMTRVRLWVQDSAACYPLIELRAFLSCSSSLLHLLSRFALAPEQADRWFAPEKRRAAGVDIGDFEILSNPYRIAGVDPGGRDSSVISIGAIQSRPPA